MKKSRSLSRQKAKSYLANARRQVSRDNATSIKHYEHLVACRSDNFDFNGYCCLDLRKKLTCCGLCFCDCHLIVSLSFVVSISLPDSCNCTYHRDNYKMEFRFFPKIFSYFLLGGPTGFRSRRYRSSSDRSNTYALPTLPDARISPRCTYLRTVCLDRPR